MGNTEIVISAAELSHMTIACSTCGAGMTVDGTRQEWGARPVACPACGALLPEAKDILQWYRDFYGAVSKSKMMITFRLKDEAEKS